ncbi:MAG: hypothetical protein RLZZ373_1367 [Pseudomonadota bacterium]|jgi:hypothetical protein
MSEASVRIFLQARFIELCHHLISPWAFNADQIKARAETLRKLRWSLSS